MHRGNLTSYSGMTTKIRAMKTRLLTPEQYEEITHLKSVPELISYLQNFPAYSGVLADIDPALAHRGEIEHRMNFSTYRDFSKIYHFAGTAQKKYLEFYFARYEMAFIKACLRNILASREDINPVLSSIHFKRHSRINEDKLTAATTIDEFIEGLSGSVYEKPLLKVHEFENPTLFDYEMTLDLSFFTYVWEHQDLYIPKGEFDLFEECFGTQMDLLNLLWIYRCKNYYNLSHSQIYSFLIPVYYKLDSTSVKNIVEADTNAHYFDLLEHSYYGKTYHIDVSQSLESQFGGILNTIYLKAFKDSPYSIAGINAYFHLKNLEIAKVVTAMECIRYGYKPEMIAQYIEQKRGVF